MSCRHDLANGTCIRCYPKTGSAEPGPEEDYEPNLEGPGALTAEQYRGGEIYRRRLENGRAISEHEQRERLRREKVARSEKWLRDLVPFFGTGEVAEHMVTILDELERLRLHVRNHEDESP